MSINEGKTLNPTLQNVYEQASRELSQFGREKDRYYSCRLKKYVSEEEVHKVVVLEEVLMVLEQVNDTTSVLEQLHDNLAGDSEIDDATLSRYDEMIRATEG